MCFSITLPPTKQKQLVAFVLCVDQIMDIESFSQTYWYIWLLVVLLIVILCLLNGGGFYLYQRKRGEYVHRSKQVDREIPMSDRSSISTVGQQISKYLPITNSSIVSGDFSTTFEGQASSKFSVVSFEERSELDLSLEEFQRQALNEHNEMRAMYKKAPLKLSESLNLYAQYWAEQCVEKGSFVASRPEWRFECKGQAVGENLIVAPAAETFDGSYFTALIMAKGNHTADVDCVLNELSTEVGFGRAKIPTVEGEQRWIGVAHYYPYRQLPTVQS